MTITQPDGTKLGTADIAGGTGQAVVKVPVSYSGPVVIAVTGKDDGTGTYYDEGTDKSEPFLKTDKLRAMAPQVMATVGVTPATNAAVVELEKTKGSLAKVSTMDIATSNSKIQAALGVTDVLQAPSLVDGNTGKTLDIAKPGDFYALVLAALAKTGTTALVAANSLADDLSDGKIDTASFVENMTANKRAVADTFANIDSQNLIHNDDTLLGTMQSDVTHINVPANTSVTDLQKAKAFFAELRTTLKAFANGSETGFLNTQATTAQTDLQATIAPSFNQVTDRLEALAVAAKVYEDAVAYTASNTQGLTQGTAPNDSTQPVLTYQTGSLVAAWYGYGSFEQCWTNSVDSGKISQVSCNSIVPATADWMNNRLKLVVLTIKPSAAVANQYDYTATRYNADVSVTFDSGYPVVTLGTPTKAINALASTTTTPVYEPVGTGTFSSLMTGTEVTGMKLNGTLPPSSNLCVAPQTISVIEQSPNCPTGQIEIAATDVDKVVIDATRTALPTAHHYRYKLSGSVSTVNAMDSTKVSSMSLGDGTYIDQDETNEATTGSLTIGGALIGTVQTAANKFVGTMTMGDFMSDKSGRGYIPTRVTFSGSVHDISAAGTGQYLTGDLGVNVTDYKLYDTRSPESATNYLHAAFTFTGQVQATDRPVMKLALAGSTTGPDSMSITLNYSYDDISITGSGTLSPEGNTITLSNQDGISITKKTNQDAVVTSKSGITLATIDGNTINYEDGFSSSLN